MKYISVCSGIEAASVAWHDMGWEPVAFSEIEPFPSEVLKIRFPNTPNWGDMTKFNTWPDATINLLVGGTPCQSFSVAGLRQGLKDPRGNLMLTFLGIAQRYKPKWIVWENVPGVLSSNGGKDFGSFLGALGELGYGWAYRVLDAQWFGVAQRRRRVFVVGCLGDQRAAAEVLFESEGVSRNPAPSREKRQTAPTSTEGGVGKSGKWWDGGQVAATLTKQNANRAQRMPDKDNFGAVLEPVLSLATKQQSQNIGENVACSLCANDYKEPQAVIQPVPHAFKIRGGSPVETGEYGGTPGKSAGKGYIGQDELVFTIAATQDQHISVPYRKVRRAQSTEDFETWQQDEVSNTINTFDVGDIRSTNVVAQPICFEDSRRDSVRLNGNISQTLSAQMGTGGNNTPMVAQPVIIDRAAFNQGENVQYEPKIEEGETMPSLVARGPHAVGQPAAVDTYNQTINEDTTQTIGSSASDVNHYGAVLNPTMAIRRLTPVECERLQGFPDNWTRIPWKKKSEEECPDGPRYKACGNSMAVPCMKWIGRRINQRTGG